jgi:hypothetical protein
MRRSSLAGIGAIAFAVLTFVAVIIEHSPGGNYKTSNVEKFLKHGHRPVIFVATYMVYLGVVGLVFLLTRLRDSINDPTRSTAFWTLSVAGIGAWVAGWAVGAAVPVAMGVGGKGVVVAPTVTYVLALAGYFTFASGAILIGLALLLLVLSRPVLPGWVRWATLVGAAGAILAPAFFPFGLFFIWALVIGIWLLAADRSPAAASAAS